MSRDDLPAQERLHRPVLHRSGRKVLAERDLVVVSNPLDAMCHVAYHTSGFSRNRVIGMAGVLDTARFRTFLAEAAGVSVSNVVAMVLGGHATPWSRWCGTPACREFLSARSCPEDEIAAIVQRTRDGGAEIVKHLKTGSALLCAVVLRRGDGRIDPEGPAQGAAVRSVARRRVRA